MENKEVPGRVNQELKPGDIVLITRRPNPDEEAHEYEWPIRKIETIGKTGEVLQRSPTKTECYRVLVIHDDGSKYQFNYPRTILKKLSKWKAKRYKEQIK